MESFLSQSFSISVCSDIKRIHRCFLGNFSKFLRIATVQISSEQSLKFSTEIILPAFLYVSPLLVQFFFNEDVCATNLQHMF